MVAAREREEDEDDNGKVDDVVEKDQSGGDFDENDPSQRWKEGVLGISKAAVQKYVAEPEATAGHPLYEYFVKGKSKTSQAETNKNQQNSGTWNQNAQAQNDTQGGSWSHPAQVNNQVNTGRYIQGGGQDIYQSYEQSNTQASTTSYQVSYPNQHFQSFSYHIRYLG